MVMEQFIPPQSDICFCNIVFIRNYKNPATIGRGFLLAKRRQREKEILPDHYGRTAHHLGRRQIKIRQDHAYRKVDY